MRKYEVDRVHNSKDDEIYQIAQSVEQKIRTGMLMPDYEMGQKPFHHWGDVILNYVHPYRFCNTEDALAVSFQYNHLNDWFQSTFSIQEVGNDGNGYISEISVNHQCMKMYYNAREKQLRSWCYVVAFSHQYGDGVYLEYYDENNDEWVNIDFDTMDGHDGHYTRDNFKFDANENDCIVKIKCYNKKIRIRSSVNYLNKDENHVKSYARFGGEGSVDKGIVLSKNKTWLYIGCKDLHDVCVKHGGMKYTGDNNKTIYKLTNKNSKKFGEQGLMYYGYSKPRNGRGKIFQHGNRMPRKYRIGWIKCDWIEFDGSNFRLIEDGKSFDEVVKLLYRRHKGVKTDHGTQPPQFKLTQHVHFIRVNKENNCFELWNFILISADSVFIKPIFLRTLSKDEAWNILNKKFTGKIYK